MISCPDCKARRELVRKAIFNAKIKEALGHIGKGVAEVVGVKPKTGANDLKSTAKKAKGVKR